VEVQCRLADIEGEHGEDTAANGGSRLGRMMSAPIITLKWLYYYGLHTLAWV